MCDDFDHLQLINLCDTKIPTDDCFFNKKTVKEKPLRPILTYKKSAFKILSACNNFIINYLCDDFDHLQLINLYDTKTLTDDCFFNKNRF